MGFLSCSEKDVRVKALEAAEEKTGTGTEEEKRC